MYLLFKSLTAGKYACSSGNQCVDRLNVCDGIQHCRDGSDESHCLRNKKRRRKNKHKKYKHLRHDKHHTLSFNESLNNENFYTTPSHPNIFTINKKHYKSENNNVEKDNGIQSYDTEYHENQLHSSNGDMANDYKNELSGTNKAQLFDAVPTSELLPVLEQSPTAEITNKVTRSLKSLKLRVYPPSQEVYETGDVVIQCRDEGELRADVYWEKASSKKDSMSKSSKLPHGAYDYNGRLEISRILPHEGGYYICKAVGHENEAGSEILATVKVLKLP